MPFNLSTVFGALFLGKVSSRSMLLHGIKMLFVGLILTFILLVFKLM